MPYTLDRFEDNDLAVLEAETGELADVPRAHVPPEAREGDVLIALPENELDGEVRYAVDYEATLERRGEAARLRAALPQADDGDLGKYADTSGKIYDSRDNAQTNETEYEVRAGSEVLGWYPQGHLKMHKR